MCGLSGVMGSIQPKDEYAFKNMLFFHSVRGTDSTGIAGVYRDHERLPARVLKSVGSAEQFLEWRQVDKLFQSFWSCLLGHNRSATVGTVTPRNAHPFRFDDIVGMHNGTIDYQAKTRLDSYQDFQTDSEAIMFNIDKNGAEETIKRLEGAWTLVWYSIKDHTLNMIRNEKRPLSFGYTKDKKTLYFGSEFMICAAATHRNDVQMLSNTWEHLPENKLITWKIPEFEQPIAEPEVKEMKSYVRPIMPHSMAQDMRSYWANKNKNNSASKDSVDESQTGLTTDFTKDKDNCVLPFDNAHQQRLKKTTLETTSRLISEGKYVDSNNPDKFVDRGLMLGQGPWKGFIPYIDTDTLKIMRDPARNAWIISKWDKKMQHWVRESYKFPPPELPYVKYNPSDGGRHEWKHIGKKKKKVIYYKGYRAELLTQDQFEYYMSYGCSCCARRPEWGNIVLFLNKDHDFLCEYCSLDKPNVRSWQYQANPQ